MSYWCLVAVCALTCLSVASAQCDAGFRTARSYASNMVLQRPPAHPRIWGFAPAAGQEVIVNLDSGSQTVIVNSFLAPDGVNIIWEAVLQPIEAVGPHSISIQTGATCVITLSNVLIGDIWVCSGQSNMELPLNGIDNPQPEIDNAPNYPWVRTLGINNEVADTPQLDLISNPRQWAEPTTANIAGYSALCWLFGVNLFEKYGRPIGLIQSDWGGTRVEAWSSPEALDDCFTTVSPGDGANAASALFNAMINPLLRSPIYGAIWYQGESNQGNANLYGCAMKAMVGDWRAKWNAFSPESNALFPFGQVQLAPNGDNNNVNGFADVRWAQTDYLGYTPNTEMVNFFLSVAIDLPDFQAPTGSIHPRYKRQIADRMALGAYSVAYGSTDEGIFQGPLPTGYAIDGVNVRVSYSIPLQYGDTSSIFELCCGAAPENTCTAGGQWVVSAFVQGNAQDVLIANSCAAGQSVTGFRYLWRESPCKTLEACPIYSVENNLPAPPLVYHGVIA